MAETHTLSVADKFFYGLGQVPEAMKNVALAIFILFYYNNLLGLDPVLAGLSMLLALIVDSVIDPVMGALSDGWHSRWGRRHPFMYVAIAPLMVTFYFLFAPPNSLLPGAGASFVQHLPLFAWLTGFGIAARISLSLFCVPHLALGAELSTHYQTRSTIVAWREAMSAVGMTVVYVLAFWVYFDGPKGQRDATAYPPLALTLVFCMGVTMLLSALGTHRLIPHLAAPKAYVGQRSLLDLVSATLLAFRNTNFRWYFAGAVLLYMLVGIDTALLLYVNTYLWGLSGTPLLWVSMAIFVGYLVGAPLVATLAKRLEKRAILMAGTAWFAVLQLLPIVFWLLEWLPPMGTMALVSVLATLRVIQGIGTIQSRTAGGSLLADVADEYELQTGIRQEGVFFGAQLVAYKATSGLGKFISGILLALIAWPTADQIAVHGVSDPALFWLALVYGPLVSVFGVFAVWCYSHYRLDVASHARIAAELKKRRDAS